VSDKYDSFCPNVWGNEHTDNISTVFENMKKGTSCYNKTGFDIRLAIYILIYKAVRNIRHILSNYINNQCILSQIHVVKMLTISVFSFIPELNLIISVMYIVYWMLAKFVMFGFVEITFHLFKEYLKLLTRLCKYNLFNNFKYSL
jgi:hypothetical protein